MGHKSRAKKLKRQTGDWGDARRPAWRWPRVSPKVRRSVLLVFGAVVVLVAGYVYLNSTVPVSVSAVLSSSGNAQFTYTTKQQQTYSPACGCMADKSERWRGITFAAKRLEIANSTETEQTAFWIMAAFPEPLDWSPTLFRPRVRLLRLSVADGHAVGLPDILRTREIDSVTVLEDKPLPLSDAAALVTEQPVMVMLSGEYPIAAYIPVENSRVSITQRESTFPGVQTAPEIREDYPASAERVEYRGEQIIGSEHLAYPMLDLVGQRTILITEDPKAVVISGDYDQKVNSPVVPRKRGVSALVINSPFSTRISAMPLGKTIANKTWLRAVAGG